MVITACLARGSLTMSRKQTIIKDINAMQGFGKAWMCFAWTRLER